MKKFLFILNICLFFGLHSQEPTKHVRLGMNVSVPIGDVGAKPLGPLISYRWQKHEISAGLDYYRFDLHIKHAVVGFQSTYNYYLLKHIFTGFHLQYYQLGWGKTGPNRYDHKFGIGGNVVRYQLFYNTVNIGYTRTLFKKINWFLIGGGGYNYLTEETAFEYSYVGFSGPGKHHKIIPAWHIKFGLNVDIWQNTNDRKIKKRERKEKIKKEAISWD